MALYESKAYVYLGQPKAMVRETLAIECGPGSGG
jgi:hypothetical protein